MAVLRIEAGAFSNERSATNAKADRIVTGCALAWGYTGDPGDKTALLEFFMDALVKRLQEIASAEEDRRATASALSGTAADRPSWS